MFVTKEFPGREFRTVAEYEEARRLRKQVREKIEKGDTITAHILPASPRSLESQLAHLEARLEKVERVISRNQSEGGPSSRVLSSKGMSNLQVG